MGLGLPGHAAARGGRARDGAASSSRATSTRRPSPSTTSAGSCRSCSSPRSCWRSTSPPVPNEGSARRSGWRRSRSPPLIAFFLRQRRAPNPLYDLDVARRRVFWVAACAGIIVFGTLMGAMFVGQQFLQNVLGYSTLEAGLSILPGRALHGAGRPALGQARRGARRPVHAARSATSFCLLGFLTMLLLWDEGISYWKVGLGYAFVGVGVGFAGTPASHSLTGSVPVTRAGMASGHGRPPARPRRGDHAVDPRRAAHRGLRVGGRSGDRGARRTQRRSPTASQSQLHEVVRERRERPREQYPQYASQITAAAQAVLPRRRGLGVHGRHRRDRARRRRSSSSSSRRRRRRSGCSPRYHAEDTGAAQDVPESPEPGRRQPAG